MNTTASPTQPPTAARFRRAFDRGVTGVFWVVFLFVVFLAYGTIPNRFYQVMMVNSGSMSPTFEAGDLIVVTRPPEQLQPGMVLTMVVNGGIVTHRLIEMGPDGELITKGDANEVADQWSDADISVRGLYRFHIPRLGLLLNGPMQWLRGTATGSWFTDADEIGFTIAAGWEEPPSDPGCTYTLGYWKNHTGEWPVDQLYLGGVLYTKSELIALLNTSPEGDPTLTLAHQFT
ncbi:MAG TPA: signal peptidase I, partial [Anaerolineaceae bacterium]|nr:signal peptidase I [Anaerolineaceae bacterium]